MKKRKVCFVITTRGNYAKIKSTLEIIDSHPLLTYSIIVAGGALLKSFGSVVAQVEHDGYEISDKVPFLLDGDSLVSMGMSAGIATQQLTLSLNKIKPDLVFVIADRYEALSVAHASLCLNIPIAHLEGGEVSGSIDDKIRDAITKLADLHLPSNNLAFSRIVALGEQPDSIVKVGSPTLDLIKKLDLTNLNKLFELDEINSKQDFNINEEFLVISQHSVPTEFESVESQIIETCEAVKSQNKQAIWVLPNMDAGFNRVADVINEYSFSNQNWVVLPGLSFELYAILINNSICLVGNTSSGIREAEFLGVPVVNIGTRQQGRERGINVTDVDYERNQILAAIQKQKKQGKYKSSFVYGNGNSGSKIIEAIRKILS